MGAPRGFRNGPSICWHCNRQLMCAKGGFIFAEIQDPIGNRSRVHKQCVREVIGDGYTEVRPPTSRGTKPKGKP